MGGQGLFWEELPLPDAEPLRFCFVLWIRRRKLRTFAPRNEHSPFRGTPNPACIVEPSLNERETPPFQTHPHTVRSSIGDNAYPTLAPTS